MHSGIVDFMKDTNVIWPENNFLFYDTCPDQEKMEVYFHGLMEAWWQFPGIFHVSGMEVFP